MGGRPERATARVSSGGESLPELPAPARYAGIGWSRAPRGARAPFGVSRNPMGAAGVFGVPPVFRRTNTLRRRLATAWSAQPERAKAREGTTRAKALATAVDHELRRGVSRSWNHGRGTRAAGLKRYETNGASALLFLRGGRTERPATTDRKGCSDAFRPSRAKGPRSRNPRSGSGRHEPARHGGE